MSLASRPFVPKACLFDGLFTFGGNAFGQLMQEFIAVKSVKIFGIRGVCPIRPTVKEGFLAFNVRFGYVGDNAVPHHHAAVCFGNGVSYSVFLLLGR